MSSFGIDLAHVDSREVMIESLVGVDGAHRLPAQPAIGGTRHLDAELFRSVVPALVVLPGREQRIRSRIPRDPGEIVGPDVRTRDALLRAAPEIAPRLARHDV